MTQRKTFIQEFWDTVHEVKKRQAQAEIRKYGELADFQSNPKK